MLILFPRVLIHFQRVLILLPRVLMLFSASTYDLSTMQKLEKKYEQLISNSLRIDIYAQPIGSR